MRTAAAQWELEGPRMMGPMTSLKILGGILSFDRKLIFEPFQSIPGHNWNKF
jgi:hypothetical protein